MATNTYLQIEPIKGESTDDAHKDWIQVLSFSHGVAQPVSGPSGTGGRAKSRANFQDFTITKFVDKSSVDLNIHCAKGEHIAKLVLEVCQETGSKVCYYKCELENVMISSISIGGGGDKPQETVTFAFDIISWTYTAVKNDGSAGDKSGPKKWNIETNKPE
ncbi:Hcp family type VI secretion system effector [Methylobacter sp.]|uniref:Hcp family type VI secretion system effector n=1 Tax=Methylobacter sp. TaxID=2051955 RepID=UPI002FDEF1D6